MMPQRTRLSCLLELAKLPFWLQLASPKLFSHGGLLEVGMEMVKGQQIRLSNSKTELITLAGRSFSLRLNQRANAVTVKLALIEQLENLGCGERAVVKLKEHDTLGSLVGEADAHPRTAQGTYGTDYID
jgi:hypothetical protein